MRTSNIVTNEKPSIGDEFTIAGLTGIGTGFLTNPIDVLKTRLQLQGELEAPGTYKKTYNGTLNAIRTIVKYEGVLALQAGLVPVLGLQIVLNVVRLGSYNFAKRHGFTVNDNGETNVFRTAVLSGIAGSVAVIIGSPLFLTKVRLQAYSADKCSSSHSLNTRMIMKSLWQEGGFIGLYRGWNANVPRLFIGSAVQLTTFGLVSDWLKTLDTFKNRPTSITFLASIVSGTIMAYSIHPFDVMATRIYNQRRNIQGKGISYNGMFDALQKIYRIEGISGLYKGVIPNWLRLAPYVIITQLLYEKIALIYVYTKNFYNYDF